jgi:aryl-phospho-beta-D-glucosidase BglC (GH1 family)
MNQSIEGLVPSVKPPDIGSYQSLSAARCIIASALCVAVVSTVFSPTMIFSQSSEDMDSFADNSLLGRGINVGNALDAPREGDWGVILKEQYFQIAKDAGFNSVRIPINWSDHALPQPPYQIDPTFFNRVDWAIDQVLSRNLSAVIDIHHYGQMDEDPVGNAPRLLALWKQIAARYRNRPSKLLFELFNEPSGNFTDEQWNEIFPELLKSRPYDRVTRSESSSWVPATGTALITYRCGSFPKMIVGSL